MLPLELLKVIFGALSRDDLDALMLANALFRDVVLRDFAKEPLRYFAVLYIWNHETCKFELSEENTYDCKDVDDFNRRLRLGRVEILEFPSFELFDENVFEVLLPHKDAWREGDVVTPAYFTSPSLFERAFTELFICKAMYVETFVADQPSQSFVSLPAVRECTSLTVRGSPPSPITVADILEWLNADASSRQPKWFETEGIEELSDSVEILLQLLKTDFIESKTARGYFVRISVGAFDGQPAQFINKNISEVLIVRHTTRHNVEVERKPMEATK